MIGKGWIAFCIAWALLFFGLASFKLDGYPISGYDWIAGILIGFAPAFTGLVLWSLERFITSGRWTQPER